MIQIYIFMYTYHYSTQYYSDMFIHSIYSFLQLCGIPVGNIVCQVFSLMQQDGQFANLQNPCGISTQCLSILLPFQIGKLYLVLVQINITSHNSDGLWYIYTYRIQSNTNLPLINHVCDMEGSGCVKWIPVLTWLLLITVTIWILIACMVLCILYGVKCIATCARA